MVAPFVEAGYQVYWTNRRPRMPIGITVSELATEHAQALPAAQQVEYPRWGHSIVTKAAFFRDVLAFLNAA